MKTKEMIADEMKAIEALKDHPLVQAVSTMTRKQRKAFESVLKSQNRKGKASEGLAPCFAAAQGAGWRGRVPAVRVVPKDSPEAAEGVTGQQLVDAHAGEYFATKIVSGSEPLSSDEIDKVLDNAEGLLGYRTPLP